jgi:uncharacterized protein
MNACHDSIVKCRGTLWTTGRVDKPFAVDSAAAPGECSPLSPAMKKRYLRLVRRTFRTLRHPRLRHRPWWQALTRPLFRRCLWKPCRDSVAHGLAIGLFFSMLLLMPFQMIGAAVVAMRFRANVPFAMAACWISNPVTNIPIGVAQFRLGEWLRTSVGVPMPHFLERAQINLPGAGTLNAASFVLGSLAMGLTLAAGAFLLVRLFSAVLPHHLPVRGASVKDDLPRRFRQSGAS